MARGDIIFYNDFKEQLWLGTHDVVADVIKMNLMKSSHTPDIDLHDTWSDISADISTGTGTVTVTLANCSVTQDNTNDWAYWDCDDPVFTAPDVGVISAVATYNDTPTTPADPVMMYVDMDSFSSNGGNITLTVAAGGLGRIA